MLLSTAYSARSMLREQLRELRCFEGRVLRRLSGAHRELREQRAPQAASSEVATLRKLRAPQAAYSGYSVLREMRCTEGGGSESCVLRELSAPRAAMLRELHAP